MSQDNSELTVNKSTDSGYKSIRSALQASKPGDYIHIFPGIYEESIVIDHDVHLIGHGNPEEIVLISATNTVVLVRSDLLRVENITIRQQGNIDAFAIDIHSGAASFSGCEMSSNGLACVIVRGDSAPTLDNNKIHDGNDVGIMVQDNSRVVIDGNRIWGHRFAGIEIKGNAYATVKDNRIHRGREAGILVQEGGSGLITGNDISSNKMAGIEIRGGQNPRVIRNRIYRGHQVGLFIHEGALAIVQDNEIFENTKSGLAIQDGANPTVESNLIASNNEAGVIISDYGLGAFRANRILSNGASGIQISTGARPMLDRNRVSFNLGGVMVYDGGGGTLTDNDLRYNQRGAIYVSSDSKGAVAQLGNTV